MSVGGIETGELYQQYYEARETEFGTELAYVLVSGGPDSATLLNLVRRQAVIEGRGREVRALFINFGQPYLDTEIKAATAVAQNAGTELEIIEIPQLSEVFEGLGELGYPIFRELLPATLGIAMTYAIMHGASELFHGQILEDEKDIPGTVAFMQGFVESVRHLPGADNFTFKIPFSSIAKDEVVVRAVELGVDLEPTVSCLQEGDRHCGVCRACIRRRKAFEDSNTDDPTHYSREP